MNKVTGTTTFENALKVFRKKVVDEIKDVEKNMECSEYKSGYLASLKETKKMLYEVLKDE